MKHLNLNLSRFACVFATVLTTLLLTAEVVKAAELSCGSWSVVASPNVGPQNNILYGVAAVSANNVWEVGFNYSSGVNKTLIEQWNGTSWSIVPSPNVGTNSNFLYGISAVSATDIWAVGYDDGSSNIPQALFEHWNGTSWSVVPGPNLGSNNVLYGVAAVSTGNVWAVGYHYINNSPPTLEQTLIVHWNGVSWSIVPSPNVGANSNDLYGVSAVSATNIWAVGDYLNTSGINQTLVEQWNGASWNVVPSPNVGPKGNSLNSVAVVSPIKGWAVGQYANSGVVQTLIEQWNGASWSVVPSPNVGAKNNFLYGVTAVSATNSWAVGLYTTSSGVSQTLIEQWNGVSWSVVPSPNVGTSSNFLYGVVAITSSSNAWAVGGYLNTSERTLTESYC